MHHAVHAFARDDERFKTLASVGEGLGGARAEFRGPRRLFHLGSAAVLRPRRLERGAVDVRGARARERIREHEPLRVEEGGEVGDGVERRRVGGAEDGTLHPQEVAQRLFRLGGARGCDAMPEAERSKRRANKR